MNSGQRTGGSIRVAPRAPSQTAQYFALREEDFRTPVIDSLVINEVGGVFNRVVARNPKPEDPRHESDGLGVEAPALYFSLFSGPFAS